jgi:hypothetical protein
MTALTKEHFRHQQKRTLDGMMGAGNARGNAVSEEWPPLHKKSRSWRQRRQRKSVTFHNEVRAYSSPTALTQEDCSARWYTRGEIQYFRQARTEEAETFRALVKESSPYCDESCVVWYKTLLLAYKHFRPTKSNGNVAAVVHWLGGYGFLSASTLGLERQVAMEVSYDVAKKRQSLSDQVALWKVIPGDIQHKDEALRTICEVHSRPARLWAEYIAQAAAFSSWKSV